MLTCSYAIPYRKCKISSPLYLPSSQSARLPAHERQSFFVSPPFEPFCSLALPASTSPNEELLSSARHWIDHSNYCCSWYVLILAPVLAVQGTLSLSCPLGPLGVLLPRHSKAGCTHHKMSIMMMLMDACRCKALVSAEQHCDCGERLQRHAVNRHRVLWRWGNQVRHRCQWQDRYQCYLLNSENSTTIAYSVYAAAHVCGSFPASTNT